MGQKQGEGFSVKGVGGEGIEMERDPGAFPGLAFFPNLCFNPSLKYLDNSI